MKLVPVLALLLLAPMGANAACAPTDFSVKDVQARPTAGGDARGVVLTGELVNHCATPAAAQLEIIARSTGGGNVATKKVWPAGTSNIEPGKSIGFDLGRLFRNNTDIQTFAISVAEVRTW